MASIDDKQDTGTGIGPHEADAGLPLPGGGFWAGRTGPDTSCLGEGQRRCGQIIPLNGGVRPQTVREDTGAWDRMDVWAGGIHDRLLTLKTRSDG